jgi:hypothetical protein
MAVMLAVVAIWKKPLSDWRPLAAVALAAFAGEIWDVIDTWSHGGTPKWDANWKDAWNTLFWPTDPVHPRPLHQGSEALAKNT